MICKVCGKQMYLDDVDRRFKGNMDKYWCCQHCPTSCIEQIRWDKTFKEEWHSERGDKIQEFTVYPK